METKLMIQGVIDKKSEKTGNEYYEIQTNQGTMSAFDKDLVESLKESWKNGTETVVDVSTSKDGKYTNIRPFANNKPPITNVRPEPTEMKVSVALKQAAVLMSFAIELAKAGRIENADIDQWSKKFANLQKELVMMIAV